MTLTHDAVRSLLQDCLLPKGDTSVSKTVKGIKHTYQFLYAALNSKREDIEQLLMQLPIQFRQESGGGWSFLNACVDINGNLWTDDHHTVEMLLCLGIGIGRIRFLFERELWEDLPGGMPYFSITKS